MRTTLTLDNDVAAMLKRTRADSSVDFKELVNDLLRAGLKQRHQPKPKTRRYRTPSTNAGACLVDSIANIQSVLERVEGPLTR